MATGREHLRVAQRVTRISLLPTAAICAITWGSPIAPYSFAAAAGYLTGGLIAWYVTPDLDVNGGNISDAAVRRKYGRGAQWLWRRYWRRYALANSHRGESHRPFTGTWQRWQYILGRGGVLPIAVTLLAAYNTGWELEVGLALGAFLVAAFCGSALQDIMHWLYDGRPNSNQKRSGSA